MKFMRALLAAALALSLTCSMLACTDDNRPSADELLGGNHDVTGVGAVYQDQEPSNPVDLSFAQTAQTMFTERDARTEVEQGILIQLNGDSASCESSNVSIDRGSVTIRADGTYILRGTLSEGAVYVNAPETAKMQLVLDGVSIHNSTGAALCILGADKVFITLTPSSENTLSSGQSFTPIGSENVDATLYSKQDITLNGSGALTIDAPAGHGIVGKDDVVITGGAYTITAASHGIDANDSVRLQNATLAVTSGKDAVHVENNSDATRGFFYMQSGSLAADAMGDGVDASAYVQIEGGSLTVTAGGGFENRAQADAAAISAKGIKASGSLLINGGTIDIDSADDAIHANRSAVIAGGTILLKAGDDALHADEYLTISGGFLRVEQSYEGLEARDVEICGGDVTLICTDDGINAAGGKDESGFGSSDAFGKQGAKGSVLISGGSLYINASGDGIDANGTLLMTGGLTTICGPTQGDTAVLDYDRTGEITGGTFIGTGAQMMAQTFSASTQGVVSLRVGNQSAGTKITLCNAAGEVILSYAPAMSFQIVIISAHALQKGESYTMTIGEQVETVEAK